MIKGTQTSVNEGSAENGVPHPEPSGGEQVEVIHQETEDERFQRLNKSVEYWWKKYDESLQLGHDSAQSLGLLSMTQQAISNLALFWGERVSLSLEMQTGSRSQGKVILD